MRHMPICPQAAGPASHRTSHQTSRQTSPSESRPAPRPVRHRPALLALLASVMALVACASPPPGPGAAPSQGLPNAASAGTPAAALHALFDTRWEASMQRYPEWATYVGDDRFGDRLTDASPVAEAEAFADDRRQLVLARAIDRNALGAKDRASLDLFIHELEESLVYEPLVGYRRLTLGALGGFHTGFADLLQSSPVRQQAQAEQLLARLAAYPQRVDQELVRLRQGMALGWVAAQPALERVQRAMDSQLNAAPEAGPFYEPFTRLGSDIPAAEQQALQQRARQAIAEQVLPAQRRLRDFVAGDYARAAPLAGNLSGYPGGAAVYAAAVRS